MTNHPLRRKADSIPMEVIDDEDPNALTVSEIRELKGLARMSKLAKLIIMAVAVLLSFIGVDRLIAFWRSWHG